jgi:hypothetical protein
VQPNNIETPSQSGSVFSATCRTGTHSGGYEQIDRTDYSVVVKHRANPPNSWRWEIYRAGRSSPIKQSLVYFPTMVTAKRAGKEALKQLLDKLFA